LRASRSSQYLPKEPLWAIKNFKNKIWLLNNQVCVRVQQNILNAENKRDKIFVDQVETLW
jgi:hypothetical protein